MPALPACFRLSERPLLLSEPSIVCILGAGLVCCDGPATPPEGANYANNKLSLPKNKGSINRLSRVIRGRNNLLEIIIVIYKENL